MYRLLLAAGFVLALTFHSSAGAQSPAPATPAAAADVRFAVVRTAKLRVREALVFSGGRFTRELDNNFSAFLVKHDDTLFLFDSGLGSRVAEQYRQDMPWWSRPFFRYDDPVVPAHRQLSEAGLPPIERIVLSHSHWDHASGLEDFPKAEIWVPEEEMTHIRRPASRVGGAWPSQVASTALRWKTLQFQPVAHEGFERSLDMFGDGSVVLVPMFGHTPGSVGMFLRVTSGQRYFLVGDAVWSAAALKEGRPKLWAAGALVDHQHEHTQEAIGKIRAVMARHPDLIVVPAHDGAVQDALGYFPNWVPAAVRR